MAHNKDILRSAPLSDLFVPSPTHLREMDILASQSINGDAGGTYEPKKPIIAGGEGLHFDNVGSITGGIETSSLALPGALSLTNTWPSHDPRIKRVVFPIRDVQWTNQESLSVGNTPTYDGTYLVQPSGALQVERSITLTCPLPYFRFLPASKIVSIALNFRVGTKPAAIPTTPMSMMLSGRRLSSLESVPVTRINPWQPTTSYKQLDLVIASNYTPIVGSALAFRKLNAGSAFSGASEPAGFATAVAGSFIVEGGINWLCFSLSNDTTGTITTFVSTKYAIPATPDLYYNSGQPQVLTISAPNIFNQPSRDFDYVLFITDPMNTRNIYTSIVVEFETTEIRP